jgi:hypothetical protein
MLWVRERAYGQKMQHSLRRAPGKETNEVVFVIDTLFSIAAIHEAVNIFHNMPHYPGRLQI